MSPGPHKGLHLDDHAVCQPRSALFQPIVARIANLDEEMADEESIFEDGENLQAAIQKSLQEKKALLCFVSDDGDEATEWEVALLDSDLEAKLKSTSVALRLKAGSEQAGYLQAVCPIQGVPAVIIILNAQVVASYQAGQTSFEHLRSELTTRYGSSESVEAPTTSSFSRPRLPGYIDLQPSEGRMRLPNNAYDQFRKLTQQYLDSGVSGKALLQIQLRLLHSLNIDTINMAVNEINTNITTITEPKLSEEVTNRLLNAPASGMESTGTPASKPATLPQQATITNPTVSNEGASNSHRQPQPRSARAPTGVPLSSQPSVSPPSANNTPQAATNIAASQRAEYVQAQKAAEAERARIKAQIEADKRARRDADRKAREEAEVQRRRTQLHELRKANSTTSDPRATDVRLQVRLFDGATIRKSFPAESTVSKDVRSWIDGEVTQKSPGGGQPYNLKLILTPLPNRQIEAGEEDSVLPDIEGVKGSATFVMVPVQSYVESYHNPGSGGLVGNAVGAAQTVVGTGIGLMGSAAGLVLGGLGRLMGGGAAQNDSIAQAQQISVQAGPPARDMRNVRVRTLGDQRRDEEEEAKRRGTDLYNGMGLNVQPRRNEDEADESKER